MQACSKVTTISSLYRGLRMEHGKRLVAGWGDVMFASDEVVTSALLETLLEPFL